MDASQVDNPKLKGFLSRL
ncbi:hypothetical protein CampHawk_178 [Bacillus phage CampHawk]|uniref:Uncharacterized protein n=1 Tax=Bacillus phage CampHawk TaxID=1406783 RepID=U5PTJ5_9CAUD|nr:hypothetical protein CampHawk_178 [Bacillus phage CampHawk]AGY47056.1 hypothetical protein CampHawk_178 [Bacillus phage CampHawk]